MIKTIYVYGSDGIGWSIDSDRYHTEQLLRSAGFIITRNPFLADAIHFVWWDQIKKFRLFLNAIPGKKVIATITNNIEPGNALFEKLKPVVDCWIAANCRQQQTLQKLGVRCEYQPFYVDEQQFLPIDLSRKQLCDLLGMDAAILDNRLVLASYQRDTNANLREPKWQKGPELLLELMLSLKSVQFDWVLLLAGPRRHWLINECKHHDIPYVFYGQPPQFNVDDIAINNLSAQEMTLLYNLADIYIISSVLEGGPKGLVEASLCSTPVISTDVGWTPDMLSDECLYSSATDGKGLIEKLAISVEARQIAAEMNRKKVLSINQRKLAIERWKNIYQGLEKQY